MSNSIPFIDLKAQYALIKDDIQKGINDVLEHGMYINGPEVQKMEEVLANYVGAKHCLGISSGTDALLIALMAIGIKPGDEVIVPAFSFYATAEMITLLGAKVIFCDIDTKYFNIDHRLIEAKITDKTKAIIPVGIFGQVANIDPINELAKKHNLTVIEDAAQSFGAMYNGKKSCNLTAIGCTSFFPAKPLGCYGDGGALFTNDTELYTKMKFIREHGQSARYTHTLLGVNGRLDSIQCAVIIEKMKIFEKEIENRQVVANKYSQALKDVVHVPPVDKNCLSVWAQYTIRTDKRDELQKYLTSKNIPTAIHYPIPIPKQPFYQELGYGNESYPVSERLSKEVISLPMHPYMKSEDQDLIIKEVLSFF